MSKTTVKADINFEQELWKAPLPYESPRVAPIKIHFLNLSNYLIFYKRIKDVNVAFSMFILKKPNERIHVVMEEILSVMSFGFFVLY